MKKSLTIGILAAATLALAACGSSSSTSSSSSSSSSETPSSSSTASSTTSEEVVEGALTYAQYMAADADSEVTVVSYIQDKEGFSTNDAGKGTATLYTQDKDGAYFAYNAHMSEEVYNQLSAGTRVKLTGTKSEYQGEVEVFEGDVSIVSGASYVAPAYDVSSLVGSEDLEKYKNQYVSFKDMEIVPFTDDGTAGFGYGWDGSGTAGKSDVYFKAKIGDTTLNLNVRRYLRGADTEVYKKAEALKVGDKIDAEGFLYWYMTEGQPRITSITVK